MDGYSGLKNVILIYMPKSSAVTAGTNASYLQYNNLRLDVLQANSTIVTCTGGAIDLSQEAKIFDINLTGATTAITVTNYTVPRAILVNFIQDGTGGRLITWPTGTKTYPYGIEPPLTPDANAIDSFVFIITAENTYRIYNAGYGLL
jgi:hypothetical protein